MNLRPFDRYRLRSALFHVALAAAPLCALACAPALPAPTSAGAILQDPPVSALAVPAGLEAADRDGRAKLLYPYNLPQYDDVLAAELAPLERRDASARAP